MLFFVWLTAFCIFAIRAEEGNELTPSEKGECVNQLLEWCNGMQYAQGDVGGIAILSLSYQNSEDHYRVFCASDSEGTNCTRNGSPWYTCSPDHVLTYKGEEMSEGMTDVDNDICETANKVTNELFVSNDNVTLTRIQEEMESFFESIARMQEQMFQLKKLMTSNIPLMGGDFFGGFDFFPNFGQNPEIVTLPPDNEQPSNKDSNDIEKE